MHPAYKSDEELCKWLIENSAGSYRLCAFAAGRIQSLKAHSGWISVDDRLPEKDKGEHDTQLFVWVSINGDEYFAVDEFGEHTECSVSFSSGTIVTGEGWQEHDFEQVTHWMLPEPPAKEV